MKQSIKKSFAFFLLSIFLVLALTSCSSRIEKNLPGSWDNGFHILTFYSDGTYEESLSYGTGTWTILEGDVLKLTDFYGNTRTHTIKEITSDSITLETGSVWDKVE